MRCSVAGCDKNKKTKGLCAKHYARLLRYGRTDLIRRENGLGNINKDGYVDIRINGDRTYEHILVAEAALGKQLPPGAVVHHIDEDTSNNTPTNLVVCPGEGFHRLIHRRMDARKACGNADWLKCTICKNYDEPALISRGKDGKLKFHLECARNRYRRNRYGSC